MNTIENIVGKWTRIESIRNIRIKEVYAFYSTGAGELWITDNCDGYEEHAFCYDVNLGTLYLVEGGKEKVIKLPITVDGDVLTISDKGISKQYTREDK